MIKEKLLCLTHPVCCIITGPSECGEPYFLKNLILNIINEVENLYIYSSSLQRDLYQKIIKCFSNYISIYIIPKILNEDNIDLVNDELIKDEDFGKPETQIKTYESKEELKYPKEYEDGGILTLDDVNENKWMILEYNLA